MDTKLKNLYWGLACLLIICAWISGLFIDLTGDAGLYATISRQMVESGDWLSLKINGVPYIQKPHLFFWLAGAGINIFGNTNFAFKIFPFLFGLSGLYFTYRLGRSIHSELTGRLAVLFAGSAQMYFLYFFDLHTDTVLQSAVILSLWQFAEFFKSKYTFHLYAGFFAVGLAMLTKGPVGAVVPLFFVVIYQVSAKNFFQLFNMKWLTGIFLVLLIISPTLFHLWNSFGAEGLRFYFIENQTGRISGNLAGSSTDPFYYLYNLLWAFLPWTVPVVTGLVAEVNSWIRKRKIHHYNASLFGSVLILLVVFSLARGKAPNYLMIFIPPLSVVAAAHVQHFLKWPAKMKRYVILIHSIVLAAIVLFIFLALYVIEGRNFGILLLMLGAGAFLMVLFFKTEFEKTKKLIFTSIVIAAILNLFLNVSVLPTLFRYQGARQALTAFDDNRTERGILKNLQLEEYELFFWSGLPVETFSTWEDFYSFLEREEPWVYTNERGLDVVKELTNTIDTVITIEHRGMNEISLPFLNPRTRMDNLKENYLIKVR